MKSDRPVIALGTGTMPTLDELRAMSGRQCLATLTEAVVPVVLVDQVQAAIKCAEGFVAVFTRTGDDRLLVQSLAELGFVYSLMDHAA